MYGYSFGTLIRPWELAEQMFGPYHSLERTFWSLDSLQWWRSAIVCLACYGSNHPKFSPGWETSVPLSAGCTAIGGLIGLGVVKLGSKNRGHYDQGRVTDALARIARLGLAVVIGYGIWNFPDVIIGSLLRLWYLVFIVCALWWIFRYSFGIADAEPLLGPIVAGTSVILAAFVTLLQGPGETEYGFWITSTMGGMFSTIGVCVFEYIRLIKSGETW